LSTPANCVRIEGLRITPLKTGTSVRSALWPDDLHIEGLDPARPYMEYRRKCSTFSMWRTGFSRDRDGRRRFTLKFRCLLQLRPGRRYRGNEPLLLPYSNAPVELRWRSRAPTRSRKTKREEDRVFFSADTNGYKRNRILYPRPEADSRSGHLDAILNHRSPDLLLIDDTATSMTLSMAATRSDARSLT